MSREIDRKIVGKIIKKAQIDPDYLWATNARESVKWEEIERGVFKSIELGGEE